MELTLNNSFSNIDRLDDGVTIDYAFLMRMWSAFDRSITRFNRECGVLPSRPSRKRCDRDHGGKKPDR